MLSGEENILRVKVDRKFPRQVLLSLSIVVGLAAYPLLRFGSYDVILAAIAGALLSTVNVLLGYLAIELSIDKSYSTFLKTVLGGMGVRMAFMLTALVVLIRFFKFHAMSLTVSMLGLYVLFLALEVLFIQKKVTTKEQG